MAVSEASLPPVSLPYNEDEEADAAREEAIRGAASHRETPLDERDSAPLDASGKDAASSKQSKRKGKKMVVAGILLMLLFLIFGVGLFVAYRVMVGGKKNPTLKVGGTQENAAGGDTKALTDEEKFQAALAVLAEKDPTKAAPGSVAGGGAGADAAGANNTPGDEAGAAGRDGTAGMPNLKSETVPGGRAGGLADEAQPVQGAGVSGAGSQTTGSQRPVSGPDVRAALTTATSTAERATASTSARSVLHSPRKDAAPSVAAPGATRDAGTPGAANSPPASSASFTLPSFGAMLPVRSLGAIYTLRSSGGVVRFEVAYEKRGRGWVIPKGTEIIGVVRGSDQDRAFITMTGMIEPSSGKFIKLSGDVLGADGATGIRGQKKKLASAWSRFFGRLRDAGLSAAGTLAGGLGRGPVIIADVYGRGTSTLASDLNGVLGQGNRDSFVQVKAGTSGYVFITQMPDEIHGLEELASRTRDSIGSMADTARRRLSTGLSEDELAELLTQGDAETIRRALPRMTPDMRRVAEAFLGDEGSR